MNRKLQKFDDINDLHLENEKPCFDCHVGLGPGACCGKINQNDYLKNVSKVEKFLNGNQNETIDNLHQQMQIAAENLDFERANRIKQRLDTINFLTQKQNIVSQQNLDADIIGFYREETITGVHVLIVREGRIINSNEFIFNRGLDVENAEIVHMFLLRYYDNTTSVPKNIVLNELPDDVTQMED